MRHQRGLSRPRRGRGQIVLVPNGLESDLHQRIPSVGHRHRDDRPDTGQASVPRRTLLVFTMTPHTSRLLVLTHSDATNPIPSAAQQSAEREKRPKLHSFLSARKPSSIRGRCLVGESATRRDSGWCPMALYGQLRRPLEAHSGALAGSPKAGVASSNLAGGTSEAIFRGPPVRVIVYSSLMVRSNRFATCMCTRPRAM